MTRTLQIQRSHLRALLLLLAVLPLVPTGVMVRYMADNILEDRRELARDMRALTERQAGTVARRLEEETGRNPALPSAQSLGQAAVRELGPDAIVRVLSPEGEVLYSSRPEFKRGPWYALKFERIPLRVEWARPGPGFFSPEFRVQSWQMIFVAGTTFTLVSLIAIVAGREMLRRMEVAELRLDRLSQIAHEMRTPVASLRAIADTLRHTGAASTPEAQAEYYAMLDQETRRLWLASELFLWHARLEGQGKESFRLRREQVPLAAVLEESAAEYRAQVAALGGTLRVDLAGEDFAGAEVHGDPEALRAIVRNLLDNAVKYRGERPPEITLRLRRHPAGELRVEVEDRGVGIPAPQQKRVFESFVQVDDKLSRRQGGCGLGLSIVRRLTEAHGGRVALRSEPGQGATFTLSFPQTV